MMSLRETAMVLGTVVSANASGRYQQISTDSRDLLPGSLFVALRGPNHDGHDHLAVVEAAGAVGAIVEQRKPIDLPQLVVPDSRAALGKIAAYWRRRLPLNLVAITGSNGKTTVKNMVAEIVAEIGKTLATEGNQNNEIGVPLTLLKVRPFHQFAVVEMGMSGPGELTALAAMGQPDVAVITNAGPAHLAQFDDITGVAAAKGEILSGLSDQGIAIINGDDPAAGLWRQLAGERQVIDFSMQNPDAAIYGQWQNTGSGGTLTVCADGETWQADLFLLGRHNGANALAAIAVGQVLGVTPAQMAAALARCQPAAGRLQPLLCSNGLTVIDDSYNANPASMQMAIAVLAQMPGRRTLVLGDMGELGGQSKALHRQLAKQARAAGIERMMTTGELSAVTAQTFGEGGEHFDDQQALIKQLKQLSRGDTVLIKGSRAAGMDRVVAQLMNDKLVDQSAAPLSAGGTQIDPPETNIVGGAT
ncbi:MAG: UDP-N-acetylmuramoyl-tripeptide--D-alanyl-D-alanine ligase [Immundisolibacteraceae bacterium]|nr:UDP-N-acetylmuramoyl-tripeptide--D-alanyl-D-alanine ligase [Immundisolibacteraceae bacterium]